MRIKADVLDGSQLLMQDFEALKKAMTPEACQDIANAGGDVVCYRVGEIVRSTAQTHPRGLLAGSISHAPTEELSDAIGVSIGWKKIPIKASSRMTPIRSGSGRVHMYRRKVSNIADVGRILEYSDNRQLRHMEIGYEAAKDSAERAMLAKVDALLDKTLD